MLTLPGSLPGCPAAAGLCLQAFFWLADALVAAPFALEAPLGFFAAVVDFLVAFLVVLLAVFFVAAPADFVAVPAVFPAAPAVFAASGPCGGNQMALVALTFTKNEPARAFQTPLSVMS